MPNYKQNINITTDNTTNISSVSQNKHGILLEGKLCFYFPFKVKDIGMFRIFRKHWTALEKRHENIIQYGGFPRTELMDREAFVEEREKVLSFVQQRIPGAILLEDSSPYATPCIKNEYRHSLSENINSKEISIILSHFRLTCDTITGNIETSGSLLLNINLDNLVATPIILLNFEDLSVDAIISLKHCYYKHALVHIREFIPTESTCKYTCNFRCVLADVCSNTTIDKGLLSMHQYIYDKVPWINNAKATMSYKMRYSLLEINKPVPQHSLTDAEIYGMLCADEGWGYAQMKDKLKDNLKDISNRDSYDIYLKGGNGLILTDSKGFYKYKSYKNKFFKHLSYYEEHIRPLSENIISCIPSIGKGYYAEFLKAVEISYLIHEVNTNEISPNVRSYINPWIIANRCYKLWKIIHEVDTNTYHTSSKVNKSFYNDIKLNDIRKEYGELLSHGINFLVVILTLMTLLT